MAYRNTYPQLKSLKKSETSPSDSQQYSQQFAMYLSQSKIKFKLM